MTAQPIPDCSGIAGIAGIAIGRPFTGRSTSLRPARGQLHQDWAYAVAIGKYPLVD